MNFPPGIQKYLSKQNSSEWNIELPLNRNFSNIIVVPTLDELEFVPTLINSLIKNSHRYLKETLVLFVVNNLKSHPAQIKVKNQKLIKYLKDNFYGLTNSVINCGIVDASSDGKELPEKTGGVGLARKIGMDLALNYFDYQNSMKKILISLDADCMVSDNYLESIVEEFNKKNYNAAVINYEHRLPANNIEKAAIINYELFLRYYLLGLKYAKSHYAYHSVGSTIVCNAETYVKIGGMNKRKAGEDFYFLEKLIKVTDVHKIVNATVFPSARISLRVPFGTGRRIKRFTDKAHDEYLVYSPETFEILKQWLSILQNLNLQSSNKYLHDTKKYHPLIYSFLLNQNFEKSWNEILRNSKSNTQIQKQKKIWMDGFRTLKMIHYIRDKEFPMVNTFKAINLLFEKMKIEIDFKTGEEIPPFKIQLKYLKKLREIT